MNSTEYYRKNPDAAARKVAYQKKVNARPEEKKRRAELNKERRRRGIAGKGGPDVSHTTSGKTVLEDPHTNRGRQGAGGKPKLKKDVLTDWVSYDGAYAYGFTPKPAPTRQDAAGKPCGQSYIPKTKDCTKKTTKTGMIGTATAGKVLLTAGALAGGAALLTRKKPISLADWRKSPKNPRNKPKLSPEEANRISKEAIAKGKKLDIARPGCSLKKTDSRTDAFTPAKTKCGSGAFGTYYVHQSNKYGVKTFSEFMADEADPGFEFDMLGKAHHEGVNVPEPLAMNSVYKDNKTDVVETLIMRHMDGYKTLRRAREGGDFPTVRVSDRYGDMVEMPRLIQLNFAREMKKLHLAGMSHGDLHLGNIMYKYAGENKKKIGLIDMGYAMDMDTDAHPIHGRSPSENLLNDLRNVEDLLGIENEIRPVTKKGLLSLIEETAIDYSARYDTYEVGIGAYYDLVFRAINRNKSPRSAFVSSVDRLKIPGLNKAMLQANYSPSQLQFMNTLINNGGVGFNSEKARAKFKKMGMRLTEAKAVLASLQKN